MKKDFFPCDLAICLCFSSPRSPVLAANFASLDVTFVLVLAATSSNFGNDVALLNVTLNVLSSLLRFFHLIDMSGLLLLAIALLCALLLPALGLPDLIDLSHAPPADVMTSSSRHARTTSIGVH